MNICKGAKFFIYVFILCTTVIKAQNLNNLENRLSKLEISLRNEQMRLDSLNNNFHKMTEKINFEKEKKVKDKEKITDLMASSVTITDQIDIQTKKTVQIKKEILPLKKTLRLMYTTIIDSLKLLKKTAVNETEKDKLDSQIALYTGKKLDVSPKIDLLSSRPEKFLKIDPGKITDQTEKELLKGYLEKALKEVNDRLNKVTDSEKEISEVLILKKKTNKFLKEVEFESNIRPLNPGNIAPTTASSRPSPDNVAFSAAYATQVQSYSLLLNQLNYNQPESTDLKLNRLSNYKNKALTIEEYQDLMNEVKNRLEEYKIILRHKLGMIK